MNQPAKESPKVMPLFVLMLVFVAFFLYIAFKQNNQISIDNLSIFLGGFFVAISSYAIVRPDNISQTLKAFPRANTPGYVFMFSATCWFLWNIKTENMADYKDIKHWFYIGFGVVGVGSCFYLKDFLAVRGFAVFMLLTAKLILDTQRVYMFSTSVEDTTEWRMVFAVLGYAIIIFAMWMVVSPWRMRDIINWIASDNVRIYVKSVFWLLFGFLLIILGLTEFQLKS